MVVKGSVHSATIRSPGFSADNFLRTRNSRHLQCKKACRFTPESGHVRCKQRCPLSANSGHFRHSFDYSVAAVSSDGGTVRPRAFAVFRLISGAIDTHYDREASVHRFVGPKRIERIAGVHEAGVAAVG
jgi:hypothetical protein